LRVAVPPVLITYSPHLRLVCPTMQGETCVTGAGRGGGAVAVGIGIAEAAQVGSSQRVA
jgi:hypothetical protein